MSSDNYEVDPIERIRELWEGKVSSDQSFSYSFERGYERLDFDNGKGGGLHFAGAHHPEDATCHAAPDIVDGREGICVHCGRTLM